MFELVVEVSRPRHHAGPARKEVRLRPHFTATAADETCDVAPGKYNISSVEFSPHRNHLCGSRLACRWGQL